MGLRASMLLLLRGAAAWAPAPSPLMTRWAKDVHPDQTPAYPRPMMARPASSWTHLDGLWQVNISATIGDMSTPPVGRTLPSEILVPYPVESPLSGIRKLPPSFAMWYRRTFEGIACDAAGVTLLHFEAVDWNTTAYVNGQRVGNHVGGYDEFTFDISAALKKTGENELLVGVIDQTVGVKGKQRRSAMTDPSGITCESSNGRLQPSRAVV